MALLSVGIALFVVATFDVIIGLLHNLQAFVFYTGEGGAAQELADISGWINVARTAAHAVQMILGDFVLASAIPLCPAYFLFKLVHFHTFPDIQVQNTLTTGLLIWRIWRVEREIEEFRTSANGTRNNHSPFRKVIRVIAESGFAYTLMVFLTFLVDLCNTNLVYCFADLTHQATGIAFNVVIMRTSPSRDEQFTIFAAKGLSAAENGALNRLRFRAPHTELPADIDDDDFAVKSIRASPVGPHEDLQMNTNTYNTHDKTEPEGS
ncbi:hypothetical protein B0H14DRAFT_3171349 [Mycena olivaceomarginata]|nr:hypothetical protein B0H14DRAFT_3171349 [Mycena olivaceomarginata]